MAVKVRLRRLGGKKDAFFRIVVADSRTPRDGRFIEELGYYDPNRTPALVQLDEERVTEWLDRGARPSATVKNLLQKTGVIARWRGGDAPEKPEDLRLVTGSEPGFAAAGGGTDDEEPAAAGAAEAVTAGSGTEANGEAGPDAEVEATAEAGDDEDDGAAEEESDEA